MASVLQRIRLVLDAMMLLVVVAAAAPACAQPTNSPVVAPVTEEQLLRQAPIIRGRASIPDAKSYIIEQPAGRAWQRFHEVTLHWLAGLAIGGMLVVVMLFYLVRGMVRLEAGRSGRVLVRFNAFERFVHWMTAVAFVILAITGLNMTFGKEWLLPYLAPDVFAAWSQWAKYAHDYLSFPFTLGVALICLMWVVWSFPGSTDITWLVQGGGIVGHGHPDARRFNAGQKLVYWIVVLGGGALAASGYVLMFPFGAVEIAGLQLAHMVHAVAAVLFVVVMIAHAYIGSIGMEGAFEGMWRGTVDENWAREHHRLWHDKEKSRGRIKAAPDMPPDRRVAPAE